MLTVGLCIDQQTVVFISKHKEYTLSTVLLEHINFGDQSTGPTHSTAHVPDRSGPRRYDPLP
jgi:hypothetical protein